MPYMGVIYVVVEALKLGYSPDDQNWANLGQGQPEVGTLEGAPPRLSLISLHPSDYAYGPVEGVLDLRAQIADHYNRLYRRGLKSQYAAENVVIAPGGRTTLTRAFAALRSQKLGYFIPDYSAYEDLLSSFKQITPVMIPLHAEDKFSIELSRLKKTIAEHNLHSLLISNPCNPTGRVIAGEELQSWIELSREQHCSLLLDEYYSHYIWRPEINGPVSSAQYIEDVNRDAVILFDGLTKNFRYPGFRLGWAIGPKDVVKNITAAGSFIDGGPPRPMQRAAMEILETVRGDQETSAVRATFQKKRDLIVEELKQFGITFPLEPEGTFYAFGCIRNLPPPLNDAMGFFRAALQHQVLTVPGTFFDVNPNKERTTPSPLQHFVRFSFGPPEEIIRSGLLRLKEMLKKA